MKKHRAVLFVCTGNTCRSPMAEAIARNICNDKVQVSSCGVKVVDDIMNSKSIIVVKNKLDIDIGGVMPKSIYELDLNEFDTIYSMDGKVTSFLQQPNVFSGQIVEILVEDPYGYEIETYYTTYETIYQRLKLISNENGSI